MVFGWTVALATIAFFFLWLEIIFQLQGEWSLNPQYRYGWTVPFLAAWLFYQRWICRPAPAAPRYRSLTISLVLFAAAILLPVRLIAVANPDWRLVSWTMSLVAVIISLCLLHLVGGAPWARHFAFPILFFLVATPWPMQLEQLVVQLLMRADTASTIQILNLFGTLAVQHGNVIELSTGRVGIDDACTGVRSLQATLMVALFLGEFYRMRVWQRATLVVAGVAIAFICNIGRTFLLCEVAANSGVAAIHRWHDPAGFTILIICFFALWGLSTWLRPVAAAESVTRQRRPAAAVFQARLGLSALVLWIVFIEIAVAVWYGPAAAQKKVCAPWSVAWPTSERDYRREAISATIETLLRYNEGGAATWRSADDRRWMMYYFRWLPGRTAALFVKNHRPEICLPASGLTMEDVSGVRLVALNGVKLPIRSYRFNDGGRPLHVFYCYWDGRSSYEDDTVAASEDWTVRGRLRAAWQGKRELGTRMLELVVWGQNSDADARAALERELGKIVHSE